MKYYGIAVDRVRYVGEPVAIVCAANRYLAEDALEHIQVDYRPLPAVVDPVAAAATDAPVLHPDVGSNVVSYREFRHGDAEKAFAERKAAQRDHDHLSAQFDHADGGLCGRCRASSRQPADMTSLSNFQGPFSLHPVMARALRIPAAGCGTAVRSNSGGSFGSKLALFPYIVVLCIASRIAGRPVKWIEDRLEHLAAASSAPNRVTQVRSRL